MIVFQEIVEEAIQKREKRVESAETVLVAVATKQERLYSVVMELHRERLYKVEETMSEVGGAVGGASPSGGYVNREKQLHSLQVRV